MMEAVMMRCCGLEGKPDFEKIGSFTEAYGRTGEKDT
jgi:hypothetical protein